MDESALEFIKACVRERKVYWTYHVTMRLKERFIPRAVVLQSADTFEIIEEYGSTAYLPSYLIYARHGDTVFHIHVAVDGEGDNIRIVTVYRPSVDRWEPDLKTRRKA